MKQSTSMITGTNNIELFIELGSQPNGNLFFSPEDIEKEDFFTLNMSVCKDSWLVQLDEFPTPNEMFSNHPYISGYSMPVVEHFNYLASHIVKKLGMSSNSLVLDIGANDGTLLSCFKQNGMITLGIDPGSITGKLAKENGLLVAKTFWDKDSSASLKNLGLTPSLITATAVFYHVPSLHEFVKGLTTVMDDDSVFVCQCVYLKDVIEKLQFDHFYHEHTCIYSVNSLYLLFKMNGMKIISIEHNEIHGGSIIVYATKINSNREIDNTVSEFLLIEEQFGLQKIETYHNFTKKVKKNIENLKSILKNIKNGQEVIYGIGAPVKGSTLLNFANINTDLVSKIVEVNPHKIGKVVPGVHIPIVSEDSISKQPDYYLLLAWNFKDYFLRKYKQFILDGGKIIIPNPEVHIVDKTNLNNYL